MKRLLSILMIFTACTVAYAQNYRMVDTSLPEEKETKPESSIPSSQYDSLRNIRPHKDTAYYKQFIGQTIMFYPRHPNSPSIPEYFANFLIPRFEVVAADTIWRKKRVNPRPKDYQLKEVKSNTYKHQYVVSKDVTVCGTSQRINNIPPFFYYSDDPYRETLNGYYTPYQAIEGKSFKIANIRFHTSSINPTIFTLLDERNDTVYWITQIGSSEYTPLKEKDNKEYYPVIVSGFIEKMKQLYLNKEFYIRDSDTIKFKCTEIVFAGEANNYMVPSLVIKSDSREAIIPLAKAPDILSHYLNINNPYSYPSCFTDLRIAYAEDFEKELEKERIAQADKLEKERMAKAQAERARTEALQKRTQYLNKKFGAAMAKIILSGKVQIGMTREMCKEAWGHPQKVNTTTTPQTVSEQWVYGGHNYLYFTNGRLTAVQN